MLKHGGCDIGAGEAKTVPMAHPDAQIRGFLQSTRWHLKAAEIAFKAENRDGTMKEVKIATERLADAVRLLKMPLTAENVDFIEAGPVD